MHIHILRLLILLSTFLVFISCSEDENEYQSGQLTKKHKQALSYDCEENLKKEYSSVSQCKKLLVAAIKKNGELLNLTQFNNDDINKAQSSCSKRVKKGLFAYNSCLAEVLDFEIIIEDPPIVVENDGSGDKETDQNVIYAADDLYNKVSISSFRICAHTENIDGSCGSAVVIQKNYLATNCHVLYKVNDKTNEITNVQWEEIFIINVENNFKIPSNWKKAELAKGDRKNDRCIIYSASIENPAVNIKKFEDIKMLEVVYAIGSPDGLQGVMTKGEIQNKFPFGYEWGPNMSFDIPLIQTNTYIEGGSSGGGLYDQGANLIGITTLGDDVKKSNPFNFAISADNYLKLLDE